MTDDQRKRVEEAAEKYANQFIAIPTSEEERLINSEIVQAISGHVLFGANLVMERVRVLERALRLLVELKDAKDTFGKTKQYLENQPLAWAAAREALLGKND